MLGRILVQSHQITDINGEDKARALLAGVKKTGIDCLPWTEECREWQARVSRISKLAQSSSGAELSEWPKVDDKSLAENVEGWLLVWLNGKSSLKSVMQLDLISILRAMLDYQQQKALDRLLPERFSVPSGSKIRLRYATENEPVLSVKLQEMFGATTNPAVAEGEVVLKVELLSPARRPVQVTTDLANFWTNSYPAVKKDLAGRYPKHDWPDDPLGATPTAYAKSRNRS